MFCPQRNDYIFPSAAVTRCLIICKPLAYLFLCHPSLHLLLVFRVLLVRRCLSNSWAEVVSMATAQEIGGRGFGAVAGRERWSALDKPPSSFSPRAPPCCILLLGVAVCVCMYVCLRLIRNAAARGIVPMICTLSVLRRGQGGPHTTSGLGSVESPRCRCVSPCCQIVL